MEELKRIPFYKKFGFRVLLFNFVLLLSLIGPTVIIYKSDYKLLTDRNRIQRSLFRYCIDRFSVISPELWSDSLKTFPDILNMQRILIFTAHEELVLDSGLRTNPEVESEHQTRLPHPYMLWSGKGNHDPAVLENYLLSANASGNYNLLRTVAATRTIPYGEKLDRVVLMARLFQGADGESYVLVLCSSVVDILVHNRAIKERFLFLYIAVLLMALLLSLFLSRSVISPLKRLYALSTEILKSGTAWEKAVEIKEGSGEVGRICQSLASLAGRQREQAEVFRQFSSDIVHELKTPLSAIKSGFELYSESDDEEMKEEISHRINKRIRLMDTLMEEIRELGLIETEVASSPCRNFKPLIDDLKFEFRESNIAVIIDDRASTVATKLSAPQLYQILSNLLKNAVSFSPQPGSVEVAADLQSSYLVFAVRDSGPGISDEAFPRLTDRFFSYRQRGSERHSGLGLSIVSSILAKSGGKLVYGNRNEGGAEFFCYIPLAD